jgi:hypothetical protein
VQCRRHPPPWQDACSCRHALPSPATSHHMGLKAQPALCYDILNKILRQVVHREASRLPLSQPSTLDKGASSSTDGSSIHAGARRNIFPVLPGASPLPTFPLSAPSPFTPLLQQPHRRLCTETSRRGQCIFKSSLKATCSCLSPSRATMARQACHDFAAALGDKAGPGGVSRQN